METRRVIGSAAFIAAALLALAACASGGGSTRTAGFDAAVTRVVNPSNHKGGTLRFGMSGTPDSTDPGNTYITWDFTRLYAMPLMTYKSCPSACGLQVVPELATGPGVVSDHGLTWTYHLQPNVKFEDSATVTSADVKYAVERTFARSVLPLGPSYFPLLLASQKPAYPGPYIDRSRNLMGLKAVQTPNPTTVVFHLAHPFADFNYVAAIPQTAPVPPAKDTGANYQLHPISTGPYKFASYQPGKQLTLVPNPSWNPATDPTAKQLASKITVTMNLNAGDLDSRLLAGYLDLDAYGTGVQAATRARILSSPSLQAHADNPITGVVEFFYLNTKVAPLNNLACRRAIEYAANKVNLQTAFGGPYAGAIANTVSPPSLIGHKNFDLYEATTKPTGDLAAAREQLRLCGQPNGFTTGIAYQSIPAVMAAATALQASLSQVGIQTTLHGYPGGSYYANFAGVPTYTEQHDLGIAAGAWLSDWPDGYGFFDFLTNGAAISPAGNTNIEQLNDPAVNNDLAKMASTSNDAQRNAFTNRIDLQVMKDAAILPEVYAKVLLYRNPDLTNVYIQPYYGMYNYAVLGLK